MNGLLYYIKYFGKVEFKEEWNLGSILVQQPAEEMERHNRELIRARSFIRSKRKKSEFELCVMGNYEVFYDQAMEACKGLAGFCEERGLGRGICVMGI